MSAQGAEIDLIVVPGVEELEACGALFGAIRVAPFGTLWSILSYVFETKAI